MKFKIEPEVFEKFPDLIVAMPVITSFDNTRSKQEALEFLRQTESEARQKMTFDEFWKDPRVTAYLDCFKAFGVDPNKFLPAHVALAKRVLEGGQLPDINPMVNLYNAMSLKYLTPFGGENLANVYGDFVLKFAGGGEQWIPIGADKSKPAVKGELIWGDDFDVSTRALNWRQCERTKMTSDTKDGYFIMDGFAEVNKDNIALAAGEFTAVATRMFGGKPAIVWLDKKNPLAEVDFESKKPTGKQKKQDVKKKQTQSVPTGQHKGSETVKVIRQKGTISWQLAELIAKAANASFEGQNIESEAVILEHPTAEEHGDYSTNIALRLQIPNLKPREIAEKIVEKMDNTDIIEKIEVAGPGFINFKFSKDFKITQIGRILEQKADYGKFKEREDGRLVIEYTDPNPFKEFHIGHLISNVTGESLARIHEAAGYKVWRADYYGDVGVHVAKSVWGLQKKMKADGVSLEELKSRDLDERVKYLGQGYAIGAREYDDPKVKEEITHLNVVLYLAAQRMWHEKGKKTTIDYDPEKKVPPSEIDHVYELYISGRQWSLDYFEKIYSILGTKFDGYYPESLVGEVGYKYVLDNLGKAFEKSEGAVIFRGEKFGLHTRVFISSHNLPTYETKELGLAPVKYQDFPYNKSIIVVGTEIKEYFKVLVEAMVQVNPDLGRVTVPICTGMVNLPQGKMSSRTGNVVTVMGLIGKLVQLLEPRLGKGNLTSEEKQEIGQKVAVAAIKYAFLKNSIGQDVVFDFEKSLSFEGDSGPYLQYTYARARSVLRKAAETGHLSLVTGEKLLVTNDKSLVTAEEEAILRWIYRFPEVVEQAARTYSPNVIASYLFELAKRFNNFYNNVPILGSENEAFKLSLVEAMSIVLKNGLNLLGIEALERM